MRFPPSGTTEEEPFRFTFNSLLMRFEAFSSFAEGAKQWFFQFSPHEIPAIWHDGGGTLQVHFQFSPHEIRGVLKLRRRGKAMVLSILSS